MNMQTSETVERRKPGRPAKAPLAETVAAPADPYEGRRKMAPGDSGGSNSILDVDPNLPLLKTHEVYWMNDEGTRLYAATQHDDWDHVTHDEMGAGETP